MNRFADLRVMALHDNRHVLQVIEMSLKGMGVTDVVCKETYDDAASSCQYAEPDVIILDVALNGGAPFDSVRAFRDQETSFNPYVPIVVVSKYAQINCIRAAINAGAHEFAPLPLVPANLAKRIYSAVFMGRPFITTDKFFGPDRRRIVDAKRKGPERRAGMNPAEEQARLEARAVVEHKFGDQLDGDDDVLIP